MKTVLNLAYGSNLHRARIEARVEIQAVLGVVALPNWGLRFHKQGADDSGKCNLIPCAGETAYGVVYAYSSADKHTLDKIEGVGKGYRNVALPLREFDLSRSRLQGHEEVHAYLAVETHIDDNLVPFDWYHGFVREGALQCGFPQKYLDHIDTFTHRRDHDEERRNHNYNILGRKQSAN